jgi:DNA primase
MSSQSSPIVNVLSRLDAVSLSGTGQWRARCPAHDDYGPSLSVRETVAGGVLLFCFAGCETADVVEAIGLRMADLYAPGQR